MASSAPNNGAGQLQRQDSPMVDEMFDGAQMDVGDSEDGNSSGALAMGQASALLSEIASSDLAVHNDFYNNFGDLFDDKDLN